MKIAFLTNNAAVSSPLALWLTEQGETVLEYSDKIDSAYILSHNVGFLISYNYQHIIKADVLNILPHRAVNLHISLLPWNRGASPNIWSFLDGTPSGVTIHEINEGLDTGDVIVQKELIFDHNTETLKTAYGKAHEEIRSLFQANWNDIKFGKLKPRKQTGVGTFHYVRDLSPYQHILNYDDTISVFLEKAKACGVN